MNVLHYPTSRDYDLLISLMQAGHRVVCFVDYRFFSDSRDEAPAPCRDVCATRYEPPHPRHPDEPYLAAQSRGICYAGGLHLSPDEFKKDCAKVNLEFIVPHPTVHVVVAYRYGLRDDHSYVVGAYATESLARQAADEHVQHRGGKYGCEVLTCDIRHTTDEYNPNPPQIAFFESPYFGILGRGTQCADMTDHQKRLDSIRWMLTETRLPMLLVRILSKAFNVLRWINPTKP